MIGVYGGSFDPVHQGHIATAREAGELAGCSQVLMIPAALSPGKKLPGASADQRLDMLGLATAEIPLLQIDRCELDRKGSSYTVETLEFLKHRSSETLLLIVGSDTFLGLPEWFRWREIFDLAHLLVAQRPGVAIEPGDELKEQLTGRWIDRPGDFQRCSSGKILAVGLSQHPISSTTIKQQLFMRSGLQEISSELPNGVEHYIASHQLYLE
ncbi:MAG: nicotinate-nucleotide adenylyltransferase [Immundisolibacteraceae bacterium]|nr:nicotinate-nucleotide adenylyltransferase [Immundisolibacteraceae bacterium]